MHLRQKSGRPNAVDYEKPFMVQKFQRICRSLADLQDPGVNEYKLASLTCQLQQYMEDNFGRYSPKPRLMTRLPASVFRDFTDNGKLSVILRAAIKCRQDMSWTEIEFKNPEMQEDINGMFLGIEAELKERSLLLYPQVYFAPNVMPELKSSLARTVANHGGMVVEHMEESTHIVEFNPEVDGGASNEIEADYLRTLEVRPDMGLAFVHWWYYPDSHDAWIPLADVEGQPPDDDLLRRPKQWRVCCRFIRDVEIFNEWGCELDYELDDATGDTANQTTAGKKKVSNKGRRSEEVARKRKEGMLPEFIETTGSIMAEVPRPTENPAILQLRVIELHNGNRIATPEEVTNTSSISGPSTTAGPVKSLNGQDTAEQDTDSGVGPTPMDEGDVLPLGAQKRTAASPAHTRGASQANTQPRKRFRPRPLLADDASGHTPDWFATATVSSVERRFLPEFFTGQSSSKTPERYLEIRNAIINMYKQQPDQYLTATTARRSVAGDVCSIIRIHEFLDAFSIINVHPKAESERPRDIYPSVLKDRTSINLAALYAGGHVLHNSQQELFWSRERDIALLQAVSLYGEDWEAIAAHVATVEHHASTATTNAGVVLSPQGPTSAECVLRFCTLPLSVSGNSSTVPIPGAQGGGDALLKLALGGGGELSRIVWHTKMMSDPQAVQAAVKAAWDVLRTKDNREDAAHVAGVSGVLGVASAESRAEMQREKAALQEAMDDYVVVRLQALEAKMKLVSEMQDWCADEQEKIELEYRDLKIQRARAGLPAQHSGASVAPR